MGLAVSVTGTGVFIIVFIIVGGRVISRSARGRGFFEGCSVRLIVLFFR